MPIRRIHELGDPLLRKVSREVTHPAEAFTTLIDLRDTLHEFQRTHGFGRGIAAIQIGIPQRVIYIEIAGQSYEILNPVILSRSEEHFQMWDDCFSFPNLMVHLERSKSLHLRYQCPDASTSELVATDDFAELLQHEIDHLDGILAIDRALDPKHSLMTRTQYLRLKASELPKSI
ncbi:peptide deformylase [Bryobacter aggregatus]|uniref:peptide deformylase n=1 Tax=Bryobacter aggregatus TaxID=360054 RepID=UPI0004E14B73|nr:peptide deformylase [Bryobacter aggregatus]